MINSLVVRCFTVICNLALWRTLCLYLRYTFLSYHLWCWYCTVWKQLSNWRGYWFCLLLGVRTDSNAFFRHAWGFPHCVIIFLGCWLCEVCMLMLMVRPNFLHHQHFGSFHKRGCEKWFDLDVFFISDSHLIVFVWRPPVNSWPLLLFSVCGHKLHCKSGHHYSVIVFILLFLHRCLPPPPPCSWDINICAFGSLSSCLSSFNISSPSSCGQMSLSHVTFLQAKNFFVLSIFENDWPQNE